MQSRVCRRSCCMLATSRPAVALPRSSIPAAQASSAAPVNSGQAPFDDPLALDLAERDQPRAHAHQVGEAGLKEGQYSIARGDRLRCCRRAEDDGLMPLAATFAHGLGKGRKGLGAKNVAIGAEQRPTGLERGFARFPAQLERAEGLVEGDERVEIARRRVAPGMGGRSPVGRRGTEAEPVPAGALEAGRVVEGACVDPGLEAVGVVERAGRERRVRDLQQVEEPVRAAQWSW